MIRPATIQDLDFLVRGNREMALETEGLALDEATLRAGVQSVLSDQALGMYRILEIDGARAAQLLLTYEWSDWRNRRVWWIQSVWVEPEHRKQGCFRQLYEAARQEAVE